MLSKKEITSIRALHKAKERENTGMILAEGYNAVSLAVKNGLKMGRVYVSSTGRSDFSSYIKDPVLCTENEMAAISSTKTPYPVIAVFGMPACPEAPAVADSLYFDRIQDPGNIGTLIRSAAAFGFKNIIFSADSADPWSPKVIRSSAGYIFGLNVLKGFRHLAMLRDNGAMLLAADAEGVAVDTIDAAGPVVLMLGNEGAGLSADVKAMASVAAGIRLSDGVESLNVAVAGSILMEHLFRR